MKHCRFGLPVSSLLDWFLKSIASLLETLLALAY